MGYYLAIDAGGTKTEYCLANETTELARVTGGTIKRLRTNEMTVIDNLHKALNRLSALSSVPLEQVTATCIGAAGSTVPEVADLLKNELRACVGGTLLLQNDVEIALDAAFPGGAGIVILAGTGSQVAGRHANGEITKAGGYGPILSDQGSGQRIGEEALRALFGAIDRGENTLLQEAILGHWQLSSVDALITHVNTCAASEISTLARIVLTCATQEDALAKEVLVREGEALARLALIVCNRLRARQGPGWGPSFAFAGSIMQHVWPVRAVLEAALRAEIPVLELRPGVVSAIDGALWRARNAV